MGADLYVMLAAGTAYLALAGLCVARAGRSTLTRPVALVCVDLFAYHSAEVLGNLAPEQPHWEWLEAAAAALAAPLLLHLVLAFVGARRRARRLLLATYAWFGAIALSSLVPLVTEGLDDLPGGRGWSFAMLLGLVPAFTYGGWALASHHRESGNPEERARTRLFLTTVAIGVGGPSTDLIAMAMGVEPLPFASSLALLVAAGLLTSLAIRVRMLRGTAPLLILNVVVIGAGGLAATLLVALYTRWGAAREAAFARDGVVLFVFAGVIVALLLASAIRTARAGLGEERERAARLAMLGRLSAQMAHDIRNPLAAIHGAAQYLEEEGRREGGALEEHAELIALILEQTARIERVVEDYRRLGRAEPVFEDVAVGELVRGVAQGAGLAHGGVTVRAEVDEERTARLDPELVSTALENLVRNAVEALDGGGAVTVRARGVEDRHGATLELAVLDDGPGMDPRTREQAEEAFFTTKAQGSGLGLAFVRRVAEAHGGELRIESALGRGTSVRMILPLDAGGPPPP